MATQAVNDPRLADAVAVNISARTLERPGFVDAVRDALDLAGLRPDQLTLELTETALVGASGTADRTFAELARIGVGLSLDDYGTGYASLTYLRRFPVSRVKIDRSFVAGMTELDEDHAIVSSSIQLARALGVQVVAEGVETSAQHEALLALGCDRLQGYRLGRPRPVEEWGDVAEDGRGRAAA